MAKTDLAIRFNAPPDIKEKIDVKASEFGYNTVAKFMLNFSRSLIDLDKDAMLKLQSAAAKRGISPGGLLNKSIGGLFTNDDTQKPVVLKIPLQVLSDKNLYDEWLKEKGNELWLLLQNN